MPACAAAHPGDSMCVHARMRACVRACVRACRAVPCRAVPCRHACRACVRAMRAMRAVRACMYTPRQNHGRGRTRRPQTPHASALWRTQVHRHAAMYSHAYRRAYRQINSSGRKRQMIIRHPYMGPRVRACIRASVYACLRSSSRRACAWTTRYARTCLRIYICVVMRVNSV